MKALTINVPDTVDLAEARWEMARSRYEKGSWTIDQAASLAELSPTYFQRRIEDIKSGHFPLLDPHFRPNTYVYNKAFDRESFDALVNKLHIEDSLHDLLDRLME